MISKPTWTNTLRDNSRRWRNRAQIPPKPASPATDSGGVELAYWNAIKESKNSADFKAYIAKFPNTLFADLANSRISALETEEKEKAVAKEHSIEDTTWVGTIKTKAKTFGTDIVVEFLGGGVFAANYEDSITTTVPGIFVNSEKVEPKPMKLSGTWRQDGDSVVVQLLQPQPEVMRLTIANNQIESTGSYDFKAGRVLTKLMSSQPCDFRGFAMEINYRVKDKIDRTAEATKIAERLKSYGMDVKVTQYNEKYFPTGLRFYNGQGNIADMIVQCVKDISTVGTLDQGKNASGVNHFALWLQK